MMKENEIVIFETADKSISLPVMIENESVWLNRGQISVVAKFATTAADNKKYMVGAYHYDCGI